MFRNIALAALVLVASLSPAVAAGNKAAPTNLAQFKAAFGGKTIMAYGPKRGTQVEYVAANGHSSLWYPGNPTILPGQWRVWELAKGTPLQVCVNYAPHVDPVTKVPADVWECDDMARYVSGIVEVVDGDPLGLSKRKAAPFVLSRSKTTIARLLAKVGHE